MRFTVYFRGKFPGRPVQSTKVRSYIAQYPIIKIAQGDFTLYSQADRFNQISSRLWRRLFVHKYQPLSIVSYSFKQLSELEQCRVIEPYPRFHTAAQYLNLGSFSREPETLPLSQCLTVKYELRLFSMTLA